MSNFEEKIMDKAMEAAMALMKEKGVGNVTTEELLEAAKKITAEEYGKTENVHQNQESVIAGGYTEEDENIIGGGIVAEPEPEPEKEEEKEEDYIIRFSKPYKFEGKTYAGVDLSGLLQMKAKDIWKMNKTCRNAGLVSVIPELDAEYTARVAAKASNLPIEFFENLPLPEMTKIKLKVSNFFM